MAAKDSHGVVVVRVSTGTIHRPEFGGPHGEWAFREGDWELFPNRNVAEEVTGYIPCRVCFPQAGTQ